MRPEHTPLERGAKVALVATSGPAVAEYLERAVALLSDWGLVPVVGPNVSTAHPRAAYLAGTDEQRAADLQWAWTNPEIDAVFCVRGGYGAARMVDHLNLDALRVAPHKPIFGSSDVTAIAEYWHEQLGCGFWFSAMVSSLSLLDDEVSKAGLHAALFEPAVGRTYTSASAVSLIRGEAAGQLVGGNLAVLAMTVGARGRPALDHAGTIALIEDINEETYRIDGFLTTLLRSGWFDGVAGVALGSWKDCGPVAEIHALFEEALGPMGIPIVGELGFGHGPGAHAIPLGATAKLLAGDAPQLVLTESLIRYGAL